MSIIECKNLTKEYLSGENVVVALNDVTVSFEKGEFVAITGPSGSGKSTFLHCLSSLENATSGEVIYNNESLKNYNDNQLSILRRRRFGFVFQAYNLVEELTGYENILLPIMLDKKKPDEEYLKKIIDILGIEDRLSHLPSALSGGQQQRIAIARALANKPTILFADADEREIILSSHLTERHARAFLRIKDLEVRRKTVRETARNGWNVADTEQYIDRLLTEHPIPCGIQPTAEAKKQPSTETAPKPAPARKCILGDLRLFFNTIERAVSTLREAGFSAEYEKKEEGEDVVITVTVRRN